MNDGKPGDPLASRRHVKILSSASEMPINRDNSSVGSIASVYQQNLYDDEYSAEKMRAKGFCNNDGTPWIDCLPKDEAALFKKGLVNRECKRQTYRCSDPQFLDTVEMLNQHLIDEHGRPVPRKCPVTADELFERGYTDKSGQFHKDSAVHILECFFEEIRNYSKGLFHPNGDVYSNDTTEPSTLTIPERPKKSRSKTNSERSAKKSVSKSKRTDTSSSGITWDSNVDYYAKKSPGLVTNETQRSDSDRSEISLTPRNGYRGNPSRIRIPSKPSTRRAGSAPNSSELSNDLAKELAKDPGVRRSDKQFAIGMEYGSDQDPGKLKYYFLKNGRLYELDSSAGQLTVEVGSGICGVRTKSKKKKGKE
ncbi:unnamed protein product [Bursaphelenchus xylophilus]|uniref:(pine wood nematode) hypothetical protein n=1 Tax=Bursaphelenchus xylophilus TaxID=6326 RepID=A0A1I7RM39_BURXY|nr:unnamed protein product [Bursaphelenchus xylophilus]CAG9118182.1 unnamed protein product [Bursaphelenchus xylophilus]